MLNMKRLMNIILSAFLCISVFSMNVYAEDDPNQDTATEENTEVLTETDNVSDEQTEELPSENEPEENAAEVAEEIEEPEIIDENQDQEDVTEEPEAIDDIQTEIPDDDADVTPEETEETQTTDSADAEETALDLIDALNNAVDPAPYSESIEKEVVSEVHNNTYSSNVLSGNDILISYIIENGSYNSKGFYYWGKDVKNNSTELHVAYNYYINDNKMIIYVINYKSPHESAHFTYNTKTLQGIEIFAEITPDLPMSSNSSIRIPTRLTGEVGTYDMSQISTDPHVSFQKIDNSSTVSNEKVEEVLNAVLYECLSAQQYVLTNDIGIGLGDIGFTSWPSVLDDGTSGADIPQDDPSEDIVASGTCGPDAYWKITGSPNDYTLTIYGNGETDSYTSYSDQPWYKWSKDITSADIQSGITSIGNNMLYIAYKNVKTVSIPDTVKTIGDYAFYLTNINSVNIPSSVEYIGKSAFSNCANLRTVFFSEGLKTIESSAFSETKIEELRLPSTVVSINSYAFEDCTNLKLVELSDNLKTIGFSAFSGCSVLEELHVKKQLKKVASSAFEDCYSLSDIYYNSSEEMFNQIEVENNNDPWYNAQKHFPFIEVTDLYLNPAEVTLTIGETLQLEGSYDPADATIDTVKWTSSNSKVATVTDYGMVTAVAKGSANITLTVNDKISVTSKITVAAKPAPSDPVVAFVTRLYRLCLNRDPDQGGLNDWVSQLKSGKRNAAQVVYGFFFSDEMKRLNLSNEDYTERCYAVMMDRASDAGGKAYWVERLNNGVTRLYVVRGFVESQEFTKICKDYGVTRGSLKLTDPRDQNYGITSFVARCYTKALGRQYDEGGLKNWCSKILNASNRKQAAIDTASTGFFHSQEFRNKRLSNTEYVKVLYRTFLGREYDEPGLKDWVGQLNRGASRDKVMNGFAYSQEFNKIMAGYGIK